MYPPNTILKRVQPRDVTETVTIDGKPEEQSVPDPLNEVRVVAPSPVKRASLGEWGGNTGEFLIIAPYKIFGSNEVVPEAVLNTEYEVVTYGDEAPQVKIELDAPAMKRRLLESPEQVFARETREAAKGESKPSKSTRVKTPIGESA